MKIPESLHSIASKIDAFHESCQQDARFHLGASIIGGSCARKIWYNFRWFSNEKFSGRILRLFRRGQNEENTVISDLESIGKKITDRQKRVDFGCHVSGSIDGIIDGKRLLEIKTHNDKSFKDLGNHGVKKSKPDHYAQIICYLYGLKLADAEYFAVNKNDDSIYVERVQRNDEMAKELIQRAHDLVLSKNPPQKLSDDPDYFECRFCNCLKVCHFLDTPKKSCRSCSKIDINETGIFCEKKELTEGEQLAGCDDFAP